MWYSSQLPTCLIGTWYHITNTFLATFIYHHVYSHAEDWHIFSARSLALDCPPPLCPWALKVYFHSVCINLILSEEFSRSWSWIPGSYFRLWITVKYRCLQGGGGDPVGRVSTSSRLGYCAIGRVGVGRCFGWLGRFWSVAQLGKGEWIYGRWGVREVLWAWCWYFYMVFLIHFGEVNPIGYVYRTFFVFFCFFDICFAENHPPHSLSTSPPV